MQMCGEKFLQADLPGEMAKTRLKLRKTHTDIQDTVCGGGAMRGSAGCWTETFRGISEYLLASYFSPSFSDLTHATCHATW